MPITSSVNQSVPTWKAQLLEKRKSSQNLRIESVSKIFFVLFNKTPQASYFVDFSCLNF